MAGPRPDLGHGGPKTFLAELVECLFAFPCVNVVAAPPSYHVKWEIPPTGGSLASQGFATLVVLFFRDAGQDHMRDNSHDPSPK